MDTYCPICGKNGPVSATFAFANELDVGHDGQVDDLD
jgi:hypothetical protein